MESLLYTFKVMLIGSGCFFTLIGLFTFFHILRSQTSPADTSNRINKIRLWWFVLTREELFADTFPWLKNDELENFKHRKYRICACAECTRMVVQANPTGTEREQKLVAALCWIERVNATEYEYRRVAHEALKEFNNPSQEISEEP